MSDTFANNVATTDRVLAAQIRQVFNDQITADINPVDIGAVASDTTGITNASTITNVVSMSLSAYNALPVKNLRTLYIIV